VAIPGRPTVSILLALYLIGLIAECKFGDWQWVADAVTRIARQEKRNARGLRV